MSSDDVYCPMIDLDAEQLVPVLDASNYPRRPSRSAIFRWVRDGVIDRLTKRRKKLAVVQIGGRVFSSIEAIRRFNAGPGAPAETPTQRRRQAQAAMAALDAIGI